MTYPESYSIKGQNWKANYISVKRNRKKGQYKLICKKELLKWQEFLFFFSFFLPSFLPSFLSFFPSFFLSPFTYKITVTQLRKKKKGVGNPDFFQWMSVLLSNYFISSFYIKLCAVIISLALNLLFLIFCGLEN